MNQMMNIYTWDRKNDHLNIGCPEWELNLGDKGQQLLMGKCPTIHRKDQSYQLMSRMENVFKELDQMCTTLVHPDHFICIFYMKLSDLCTMC